MNSRPDLLEATAVFINKEWPRSLTARYIGTKLPSIILNDYNILQECST